MKLLIGAAALMLVSACSEGVPTTQVDTNAGNTTAATVTETPADRVLALGLTAGQLEDADIVDAAGRELGEVDRLVIDSAGQLTGLVVEIEDSNPDKFVTLPIAGLTAVEKGGNRNLQTAMTSAQLQALPSATP